MKESSKGIDRRKFLKGAAIGLGFLSFSGARALLAQIKTTRKPLLNVDNFNSFSIQLHSQTRDVIEKDYVLMKQDLEKYLLDHFTMTPNQLEGFRLSYKTQKANYDRIIDEGLRVTRSKAQTGPILNPPVAVPGSGSGGGDAGAFSCPPGKSKECCSVGAFGVTLTICWCSSG
jgi:hypothetical protein